MSDIAVSLISLALVGFVLILIYSILLEEIKTLKEIVEILTNQKNLYQDIMREADEKGVPPKDVWDSFEKED
jgi:hypothetical protein